MKRFPASLLLITRHFIAAACLLFTGVASLNLCAQTTNSPAATGAQAMDGDLAWKEVAKAAQPPMPPAEWQTQRPSEQQIEAYRVEQGKLAAAAAAKAHDFYTRFPQHPQA